MGSLSSLRELVIYYCIELTSLLEEICSLQKLERLYLISCPHLKERYKETGEDRAKIVHILYVHFSIDAIMELRVQNLYSILIFIIIESKCCVFILSLVFFRISASYFCLNPHINFFEFFFPIHYMSYGYH